MMTPTGHPWLMNRARHPAVALETTLLAHGLPRTEALALADELDTLIAEAGAHPATIGLLGGRAIAGMTTDERAALLDAPAIPKVNTSNLGLTLHSGGAGATTVSATMEIAAAAGIRVFATGGLGGVHKGFGSTLDISADLAALTRFPIAVVASGVKSILDVDAAREALETLGIPIVGFRTDRFPAFYVRESQQPVDARIDEVSHLSHFVQSELSRTGRGVLIAQPVPETQAFRARDFEDLCAQAERAVVESGSPAAGRQATPQLLAQLHTLSQGRTLDANLALVRANATLAAELSRTMHEAARSRRL